MNMNRFNPRRVKASTPTWTRRSFLGQSAAALGFIAAPPLLASPGTTPQLPHFPARAKRVIFVCVEGGTSQLEMFEHKPLLTKLNGQPFPERFFENKSFLAVGAGTKPAVLGSLATFAQYGETGTWMSDRLPHLARTVDDLTFLRAVQTHDFNHDPAIMVMSTGHSQMGRPSVGAWVNYALGSENQDLPGFVVLSLHASGITGKSSYGAGFLPSSLQGVRFNPKGSPVPSLDNPEGVDAKQREESFNLIERLNQLAYERTGDPETLSRNKQYDMAQRMQRAVPEAADLTDEPAYIHEMYGTTAGAPSFANNCLMARRLSERGVRFVQINDMGGWDQHGGADDTSVNRGHANLCQKIDRPLAALVTDLKQRGLLEETLIVWASEFGRTPCAEGKFDLKYAGRDHHPYANTIWMAGAGMAAGVSHGETDEFGFDPVSGAVHVHDVHATMLHALGLDHERVTFPFEGRDYRLTDVAGKVIKAVLV
jgi:hypothetical protein